jgi:hypothetical protein
MLMLGIEQLLQQECWCALVELTCGVTQLHGGDSAMPVIMSCGVLAVPAAYAALWLAYGRCMHT